MERVSLGVKFGRIPWQWIVFLAVGVLLIIWLVSTPPGLLGKADAVGYAVCHRIDERSFHLGERQLPLCARCTGMFLGATLGLVYQSRVGRRRTGLPRWWAWIPFGMMVIAFGIDGINSFLHLIPGLHFLYLYEPQNWLRLLTGTGMGLVVSAILYPAYNLTVWKEWDSHPVITSIKSLGGLLLLAIIMDLMVLTENPLLLYPLALVAVAGVMVLLTMIYSMGWMIVFRLDNSISNYSQMVLPSAIGFMICLLQIALIDIVRYWLTGTWNGFTFG